VIRAHRVNAAAQDDTIMIEGWNIAPNIEYILRLFPGSASCGVLLYDTADVLVATGAALVGTGQPCILTPRSDQTINMLDAELGWHLLLTTTGTESQRTIRVNPSVDLPDEIHPIYGDDDIALARATAAIDAAAHYIDDVTVTCPIGLGAGLGDVASVPVDGAAVIGQVESTTWTGTPDGITEQAVIRRHVAIAPEAFVEPALPIVEDDTGAATHLAGSSGNVLTNDAAGLVVVAVNWLAANVGVATDGDNGGSFIVNSDGTWIFDPDGDFDLLSSSETADTSVTYYASDGAAEAMATLTVTVSRANAAPVAVDDTGETDAETPTSGNVLTNDTDADADSLVVSQVAGSAGNVGVAVAGSSGGLFTIGSDGAWSFDPNSDFDSLTGDDTATTSVTYHVSDGEDEDEGTLTVTVCVAGLAPAPLFSNVKLLLQPSGVTEESTNVTYVKGPAVYQVGGNAKHTLVYGDPCVTFDGSGDFVASLYVADFNTGGGDFCIDAIVRIPNANHTGQFFWKGNDGNYYHALGLGLSAGKLMGSLWGSSSGVNLVAPNALPTSEIIHVAFRRQGSEFALYIDGSKVATTTGSITNGVPTVNPRVSIGRQYGYNYPNISNLNGQIFMLRITLGEPLFTGDSFAPPTIPVPTS